ncbi:DUF1488 domain-containing protein [Alkalimonas sp. NCh-2]|uniref:DUF1488 domain-containing protein n=1 Tax=Alkalimonas sp. NCh-2 TaxID=3144846 RepID=UPI0031F65430
MNQQLIFNHDFVYSAEQDAVSFSCLLAGLRLTGYIARPDEVSADVWLSQVQAAAFDWEDAAEQALTDECWNEAGEFWLPTSVND